MNLVSTLTLESIGWTLVHFLWQGSLIGLVAWLVLQACRRRSSSTRYVVLVGAMGLCLLAFTTTLMLIGGSVSPAPLTEVGTNGVLSMETIGAPPVSGAWEGGLQSTEPTTMNASAAGPDSVDTDFAIRLFAVVWCLGVLMMALRMTRQWFGARRLRHSGVSEPDPESRRLFESIRDRLGVDSAVRCLQSVLAETPMVVGWFRPVVLMPVSVLSALDEEELTLIFLHELTHIRRQDHLLNLLQGIVEVLFFFHPVVWWLSSQIRIEREHCCDDSTLRQGTRPVRLARTLLKLESIRSERFDTNPTRLTATGGNFMNRITRLVEGSTPSQVRGFGHRTPLALILGSVIAAGSLMSFDSVDASTPSPVVQERDRGEERGRDSARGQDRDERRGARRGEVDDVLDRGDIEEAMESAGMALEKGSITPDQFRKIMASLEDASMERDPVRRRGMFADAMGVFHDIKDRDDVRIGMPIGDDVIANRVGMMMIELGMAVDSGDMSPEDAIRKVMDLARRMRVDSDAREEAPTDQRRARAAYAEAVEKMTEMVKAGEITREQMGERLEQMKRRMGMAEDGERRPAITKADYAEAVEKMTAMVKAGKISREQMQNRLEEMKRAMTSGSDRTPGMSKAEYDEAVDMMVEMVKAGKMTREQMQERLDNMNRRMKEAASTSKGMSRADFDAAVEKMTAMVKAGEITRKDMETRLGEMKRMMAGDDDAKSKKDGDAGDAQQKFDAARERMMKMLEAGEITREQMRQRLGEMRRRMGEKKAEEDNPFAAYEAMKKRLDMAVEKGDLTRKEADEKLVEFRRSMGR